LKISSSKLNCIEEKNRGTSSIQLNILILQLTVYRWQKHSHKLYFTLLSFDLSLNPLSTSMFDDPYNNLEKKLMYRYLYTCWKLMMQNFPPPPLQVSAVSCVCEESLWYTYNRRRHMNINGFPIGCRQIFRPRQPIECFVSKRHYSNVTDRKG
jgi:hypothetical protein